MKFSWCTIKVNDLDESIRFYTEIVQLKLVRRFPSKPGTEIAFLGEGETQVELLCDQHNKPVPQDGNVSLGFVVDSLAEMMEFVQAKGVPIHSGPFQPNPRVKYFFILDPNGVRVQFAEYLK